jgi:PAS domain S-box-containing protein
MNTPATILLVDDVPANLETLRELLETDQYRLIEAADGPTALRLARETAPDLVILDVMMPGMDGYEVCRRLRADSQLAEVPVIMLTALDDKESRIAGIKAGADDFLTKPFDRSELRARTRTITRLNRYRRLIEAQAASHSSEERFRALFELGPVAIYSCDASGLLMEYNRRAAELWGREPKPGDTNERFGGAFKLYCSDGTFVPHDQCAMADVLNGRIPSVVDGEFFIERPDGSRITVLANIVSLKNDRGEITGAINSFHDITEKKQLQEQALRAQRIENLGMLAAGIAHDFNNALAPIIMAGPLLQAQVKDPAGLRLLEIIEKSASRGAALVRQMLSFARGSAGGKRPVQVLHLLREVLDITNSSFPKAIRIHSNLANDLWLVMSDPTQIYQVVLNLCVNARDAMPSGGDLTLTAANRVINAADAVKIPGGRPGNFLMIEVRDTGMGILPAVLERIWEPFFTTKDAAKGTGLGLSTVRSIVRQHDGFATVETSTSAKNGYGTVFTIYMPAVVDSIKAEDPAKSDNPPRNGRGELILFVDDEQSVCELGAKILARHGYLAITASDGAEAIVAFVRRASEVRLLVTDLDMPIVGGSELANALRRIKPDLPVVAMSGQITQTDETYKQFASTLLPKPFDIEALISVVRRTLDEAAVKTRPATSCLVGV